MHIMPLPGRDFTNAQGRIGTERFPWNIRGALYRTLWIALERHMTWSSILMNVIIHVRDHSFLLGPFPSSVSIKYHLLLHLQDSSCLCRTTDSSYVHVVSCVEDLRVVSGPGELHFPETFMLSSKTAGSLLLLSLSLSLLLLLLLLLNLSQIMVSLSIRFRITTPCRTLHEQIKCVIREYIYLFKC